MIVEVAVLADYANMAEGGKLNVAGMFDRIWTSSFPALHPSMVLALRLRVEFEDREKTHKIGIVLQDEDGHQLGGGNGEMNVGSIPAGHREIVSQILPFFGTVFPHKGEYSFVLFWNGEEKARIPLTLDLAPQAPPAGTPPK